MKSAILWLLAAALVAGGCSNKADKDTIQQQSDQLTQLRAENDQLKQRPDDSTELTRLRKENEELLQLRAQVKQLQDQNKQLTSQLQTALAQRGQVQQQIQQSSSELQSLRTQTQQMQQAQAQAHLNQCVNNLRIIQAAKQQWAADNKKPPITIPTADDLMPYLPGNVFPTCPDGGTYAINPISVPPTCTIPNHVLPR